MTQVIEHDKIEIDEEYINHLMEEYKQHQDSLAIPYLESRMHSSETNLQDELKRVCTEITNKEKLLLSILHKSNMTERMSQKQSQINFLKQQLNQIRQNLQYAHEAEDQAEAHAHQLQKQLERAEEKYEEREKQYTKQKTQLDKKYQEHKESCHRSERKMMILVSQNQNLSRILSAAKVQQASLLDKLQDKDNRMKEYQEVISALKEQLDDANKTIVEIEFELDEKQRTLTQIAEGKENINYTNHPAALLRSLSGEHKEFVMRSDSKNVNNPVLNLKDDLNASKMSVESSLFFVYPEKANRKVSIGEEAEEEEKNNDTCSRSSRRNIYIDPYYAHYVLTTQSVKIKEDKDDYLGLDLKPFYHEIIDKRIPMHLWDQWIKNKLKEVAALEHLETD